MVKFVIALQIAQHETFDVVISDIGLPDGNGFDLMKKLQLMYNHDLKGKKIKKNSLKIHSDMCNWIWNEGRSRKK